LNLKGPTQWWIRWRMKGSLYLLRNRWLKLNILNKGISGERSEWMKMESLSKNSSTITSNPIQLFSWVRQMTSF
jgi:hypothetical protein